MTKIKNYQARQGFKLAARLVIAAAVFFLAVPVPAQADKYDDQINALKQEVSAKRGQIDQLRGQADSLNNRLAIINNQISQSRIQLQLAQAESAKVEADIEQANLDLAAKKKIFAENVKLIYQQAQISTLEMLLSSQNFTDFIDRQNYQEKVKDTVLDSAKAIEDLKQKLGEEQKRLGALIADQQALQYSLGAQQGEASQLLAATQGQESQYQAQIAADNKRIKELQAQQAAEIAARSRTVSFSGSGGYPWAGVEPFPSWQADPWGFYVRQCTSYAAWWRASNGYHQPAWGYMGKADAKDWPNWARNSGMRVDGVPEPGAIAVYQGGHFGHVGIVKAVVGPQVLIHQYNAAFDGRYSESFWNTADMVYIH